MAKRTKVVIIDDLTGEEIEEGGHTFAFSVSGVDYSIDLGPENARKFQAALEKYINAAERVSGRKARGATNTGSSNGAIDAKAVRAWAASNGVELSARGRIPASAVDQFRAAGN